MNNNIKQQIMYFNRLEIGVEAVDFGVLNNNIMQLREDVEIAGVEKYMPWLLAMNAKGGDVYIRPHRYGSHSVIFLDDVEKSQALAISRKYSACIIETSKAGGCHVWLQTDRPLNERERYLTQRYLQPLIHSDKGSISGEHFGRLAGVKNHKRRGCWVNVLSVSNSPAWCVPDEALLDSESLPKIAPLLSPTGASVVHGLGHNNPSNSNSGNGSESESEWGYICGKLEHGADADLLERELLNRAEARGKRNAISYAHKTIQKALARFRRQK